MNPSFNPYRQWLGIGEHELPPNLYRLIGVNLFEQDRALIAHAADRVTAYVRSIPPGPHFAVWQHLLEELAQAKYCLTDPDQKARYDAHLQNGGRAASRPAPAIPAASAWSQPVAYPSGPPMTPAAYPPPQPTHYGNPYAAWPQPGAPMARPMSGPMPMPGHMPMPGMSPMSANPMAPVVAAPPAETFNLPLNTAPTSPVGTSAPRAATTLRRRRSSHEPILIFLGIAACVLIVSLVLVLNREKPPGQVVVVKPAPRPHKVVARAPMAPRPTPSLETTSPQKPRETKEELTEDGGVKVPGLKYESDAEQFVPEGGLPDVKLPGPAMAKNDPAMTNEDPAMKPEDDAAKPTENLSAAPIPAPEPKKPAEPTPQQTEAFNKAIAAAFEALAGRDPESAEQQLKKAESVAVSDAQKSRLRGMRSVQEGVGHFWEAARDGLKGLIGTSEELEFKTTRVAVVEAGPDFIILRIAGQNRSFKLDSMPVGLAVILANRWFDADTPANKLFIGSFLFVDPMGDKAEAQRYWQEAAAGGLDVSDLMPLLELKP